MTRSNLGSIALALAMAVAPARSSQEPAAQAVFSSRTEAIRVDVLVTDQGKAVQNLTAADFEIADNGVPQRIDLISFDKVPLNVVLALDVSSSLSGERLLQLQAASRLLVERLKPDDRAALVTFTEAVVPRTSLTADFERLRTAIGQPASAGGPRGTALVDGVYAATALAESDVGRSLVVVFSDGVDTTSWLSPEDVTGVAERSDAVLYAVVTKDSGRSGFLEKLADMTAGSLFEVESTKDLGEAFVTILTEFRQRYLLSYTPKGPPGNGWHRLDVRVKDRNVKVKSRPGYWVEQASAPRPMPHVPEL